MSAMKWQTVREWEKEHGKEYPRWAAVWTYDAYGEHWTSELWHDCMEFYTSGRAAEPSNAMWDFHFEPMVCLPADEKPKWGDGKGIAATTDWTKWWKGE